MDRRWLIPHDVISGSLGRARSYTVTCTVCLEYRNSGTRLARSLARAPLLYHVLRAYVKRGFPFGSREVYEDIRKLSMRKCIIVHIRRSCVHSSGHLKKEAKGEKCQVLKYSSTQVVLLFSSLCTREENKQGQLQGSFIVVFARLQVVPSW